MEIRIGVVYTPKELEIEAEGTVEDAVAAIESSIKAGDPIVWFTDNKGKRVGVPVDKIAYFEVSDTDGAKRVGFGRG